MLPFAALLIVGCGEAPEISVVPVKGVIRIDGKPAANVMLQFMPNVEMDVPALTSTAISGPDGNFELVTADGRPGAMPGRCQVVLADLDEERPAQGEPAGAPSRIPAKYATAGSNGLIVEVVDGQPVTISIP